MAINETQGFTLDNGGKRVVVDPITRIEGHLRIEVNVDKDNVIRNAVSTGTMWRGPRGHPQGPRPARCVGLHRAHLRGVHRRARARLGALGRGRPRDRHPEERQHHPQPDAFDAVRAGPPGALLPPARARLGGRGLRAQGRPQEDLRDPAEHLAVAEFLAGLFPGRAEPPEEVRRERPARHLRQRLLGTSGLQAAARGEPAGDDALSRGARLPDARSSRSRRSSAARTRIPTGSWAACRARSTWTAPARWARSTWRVLNMVGDICDRTATFIDQVYIPDLLAIAGFYKDWAKWGGGLSGKNVMSYGEFPDKPNDYSNASMLLPSGAILNGDLKQVLRRRSQGSRAGAGMGDPLLVQVRRCRRQGLHPFDGETEPHFVLGKNTKGSRTDIQNVDEDAKYSWVKSPRWKGNPVEVGPLARYVVAMRAATGRSRSRSTVRSRRSTCRSARSSRRSGAPLPAGSNASGPRTRCATSSTSSWRTSRQAISRPPTSTSGSRRPGRPKRRASAPCEAPRGALGHWVKIKGGKID